MIRIALVVVSIVLSVVLTGVAAIAQERGQGGPTTTGETSAQEWLLARRKHQDYEKATFSFEHGVRDDPDYARTRNDWEIEFGNDGAGSADTFGVRMVRDDVSLIADLGALAFDDVDPARAADVRLFQKVSIGVGHLYAVHTMDTETDLWSLFSVLVHRPGDSVRIEWVALDAQDLRTSPGLVVGEGLQKKLRLFVRTIEEQGGLKRCRRESDAPSEKTFDRLERTAVKAMPVDFGGVLDRIQELPDVRLNLPSGKGVDLDAWRSCEVPQDLRITSLEHALEACTRALRLSWYVRTDGALAIRKA